MLNQYYIQQLMNNEIQFKIVRGKGVFGGNNNVKQISQVLALSKESSQCIQLRILHCSQLANLNGIELCKQLKNLNISCNALEDISSLRSLIALQTLDVKANRIKSLKGIENLRRLIKIDASQNRIETLEGFGESNYKIQSIILYKNNIKNLAQLGRLKCFTELKQVSFQRKDRSNPFCQSKFQYEAALRQNLFASKNTLQELDDLKSDEVIRFFQKRQAQQAKNESSYGLNNTDQHNNINQSEQFQPIRSQNYYGHSPSINARTNPQLLLMTQQQMNLEHILTLKEQTIQDLKHKCASLELTNTNQFRESIRKQAEFERIVGQVSQLSKQIDQKDHKINELHRSIQDILKVNTENNGLIDKRSQQLQKLRRQFGQLKIQNAQLRVLNKDQQNRLRQLQNKALTNIQDKSHRLEQLRGKNQQIMRENYELQHQHEEYKDRIRQLTQLLKEWQTKYEQTVKQLQNYHNQEKEQIFNQFEAKNREVNRRFEEAQKILNHEWQEKVNALQSEYSTALQGALQKYARLKRAFDDKSKTEGQLRTVLKSVMAKNTESESTIKQYEQAIIRTKQAIISLTSQHESLAKEHYEMKSRLQGDIRLLQNQLSKSQFSREKLDRQVRQLRATNQYLQKNYDNLNSHEKEFEQLLQKCQNLQTALDAKNVMLDDKNETIDSLKLQIQSIQKDQQAKVDLKQYEKLKDKYRRQKDLLNSLSQQNETLKEEVGQLKEKCQVNNFLDQQFGEVKEIMKKQQEEIKEKDQMNGQLVLSLQKLKKYSENLNDQLNNLRIQKNKLLHSIEDKENKWNRQIRQKQNECERKLNAIQEEANKYKQIAEQFKNFTKTLNF